MVRIDRMGFNAFDNKNKIDIKLDSLKNPNSIFKTDDKEIADDVTNTDAIKIGPENKFYKPLVEFVDIISDEKDIDLARNLLINLGYNEEVMNKVDDINLLSSFLKKEINKMDDKESTEFVKKLLELSDYNKSVLDAVNENTLLSFLNKVLNDKVKPSNKENKYFGNPSLNILKNTPENPYFDLSAKYVANMDLDTDYLKVYGYVKYGEFSEKSKSYLLSASETPIKPTGDMSLTIDGYAKFADKNSFYGRSAIGSLRTGTHSMFTGGINYTTDDKNNTNVISANITEQKYFGEKLYTNISGNAVNYKDPNIDRSSYNIKVTGNYPIPKVEGGILNGGSVYASGEVGYSETKYSNDNQSIKGNSTLMKGTLGVTYDILGVDIGTSVSAFNLSDTKGTQYAGGINTPFGSPLNYGAVPGYGGWTGLSIGKSDILNYTSKDGNVNFTGGFSYDSNGREYAEIARMLGSDAKKMPKEYSFGAGINTHIKNTNSDFGAQYKAMNLQNGKQKDISGYWKQGFEFDNIHGQVRVEGGYNTGYGGYFGVGGSFNIGNQKKRK